MFFASSCVKWSHASMTVVQAIIRTILSTNSAAILNTTLVTNTHGECAEYTPVKTDDILLRSTSNHCQIFCLRFLPLLQIKQQNVDALHINTPHHSFSHSIEPVCCNARFYFVYANGTLIYLIRIPTLDSFPASILQDFITTRIKSTRLAWPRCKYISAPKTDKNPPS